MSKLNQIVLVSRFAFVGAVRSGSMFWLSLFICGSCIFTAQSWVILPQVFFHKIIIAFMFILPPLLLGAGILSDDQRGGRCLLLHSIGLSRSAYVLGRWIGIWTFLGCLCLSPVMLLLLASCFSRYPVSAVAICSITVCLALVLGQQLAALVLLSTFTRNWMNSAILLATNVLSSVFYLKYNSRLSGFPHADTELRMFKVVFVLPYSMCAWAVDHGRARMLDIVVSVLATLLFLALSCAIYSRRELALAREQD